MKKLIPYISVSFVIFLFLISSRFLFFISFVKYQKAEFRKQLVELNSVKTKVVHITKDQLYTDALDFEWKEKNKELVIKGVFHEVLSIKKAVNGYLVTLIEDKQENQLFKHYFQANEQAKNALTDISFYLFGINYIESGTAFNLKQFNQEIRYLTFLSSFNTYSYRAKLIKPPGLILIS